MVFASPLPDVEIPDVPLSSYVLEQALARGDKPALIDGGSGRTITYAQLVGMVASFAGGLAARGFGPGSVLAIMAPNIPEYAVIFHGVATAGGTITTINPTYTAQEVHKQLVDSGATILVTIGLFLDTARTGAEGTGVTEIYVMGEGDAMPVTDLFGTPMAQVERSAGDVVCLPYSSGTTGLSKGVMLTHSNLVANVAQVLSGADITDDESFIAVLPFFHIYGMQVLMNTGLRAGVTIITMPRFDLEEFLRLHQEHGITRSFVAPPIVVALAKHPLVDKYDLSALRQVFSGAAPLSAELAIECGQRLGCDVVQGYGMTEMSPVSHLTPPGMFKPGSCGVTAPNTVTKVVDPVTQAELGVDADGEVCVKGPQVMPGYLNNQAATDAIFDQDGWLHTGDIGHLDADGHLWVVDRLKELIKYNGFQVPPAELEALLLTHPAIADAAVVGLPDPEAGEIPVAHVVLRPGVEATPEEIQAFVAGQVAHYKQVRRVVITDTIPKSASGKILRRLLRDQG
jgi:acyl-CoA synthetase (AMP-forming)/AMP-acid ligase II